MQKDGRVLYLTEAKKDNFYFNIPIANTTVILLGTGTSITQAAVRMLAQAGVLLGFCGGGGGGTPLYMGNEIEWLTPQSEYRPTEYLQGWLSFWFDDEKRLQAAKELQYARITYLRQVWSRDRDLKLAGFDAGDPAIADALNANEAQIANGLYHRSSDVFNPTLPDWDMIHKISRDRHNFRSLLVKIDNKIGNFKSRKDEKVQPPFEFGPKSVDELLDDIQEDIAGVMKGRAPGLF